MKCDYVFDIGANVGDFSKKFLDIGCTVIGVEPHIQVFNKLVDRFDSNKCFLGLNVGVGAYAGYQPFWKNSYFDQISTFDKDWKENHPTFNQGNHKKGWQEMVMVKMVTLDMIISRYGMPDFCKIDVEGYELEVLKGLTRKIELISIEFVHHFIDKTQKCVNLLRLLGYTEYVMKYGVHGHVGEDEDWISINVPIKEACIELDNIKGWGDLYLR